MERTTAEISKRKACKAVLKKYRNKGLPIEEYKEAVKREKYMKINSSGCGWLKAAFYRMFIKWH